MPPRGRKPANAAAVALARKGKPEKIANADAVEAENESDEDEDEDDEEDDEEGLDEEIDHLAGMDEKAAELTKQFEVVVDPATVAASRSATVIEYQTPTEDRITSDCLNYPEFVNLIGIRATHIAAGAVPYVNIDGLTDARDMAIKEMEEGKCPFLIKRYITNPQSSKVIFELWNPNEMIISDLFYKK